MPEEKRPTEEGFEEKRENPASQERWQAPEAVPEKKAESRPEQEENISEKRKEIEEEIAKKLSPELQEQAKKEAKSVENLDEQGKLERLLRIAQDRGIDFAVGVAKDMNDPYILDTFHDRIIEKSMQKEKEK